jgi:hypothetical protein
MSGKRQHFIPQFLQAGFASHRTADAAYTWVFRKGASPFNPNIANIGVEGYFYTTEDDTEADELITEAEGVFAALADSLRTIPPGGVSDPLIPELIAHLEARTRHLRQGFLRAGDHLVKRMLDFLSDDNAFLAFVERKLEKDPSILRESFAKELVSRRLPQELLGPMLELSKPLLPAMMDRLRQQLPVMAEALRPAMAMALKDAAKSGHIGALKKGIAPVAKAERYRDLEYAVVDVSDGDVILGDSILLFHVDPPRIYKTFLDKGDSLKGVYLPLSPRRLLVGTPGETWSRPSGLREPIARCSLEYFIAHEDTRANRLLAAHVGESAALITTAELGGIIASTIDG